MDTVKDYVESKRKRGLQKIMFNTVAGIKSSATVLLGPLSEKDHWYLEQLQNNICNARDAKIISYENNFECFAKQREYIESLHQLTRHKIITNFGDILQSKPTRFIDLDLMRTIDTEGYKIKQLFDAQYNAFKDSVKRKVFSFTISSRAHNAQQTIDFLQEMLGINIKYAQSAKNEYIFFINSQEFNIRMWAYRDTSPMHLVLIQY